LNVTLCVKSDDVVHDDDLIMLGDGGITSDGFSRHKIFLLHALQCNLLYPTGYDYLWEMRQMDFHDGHELVGERDVILQVAVSFYLHCTVHLIDLDITPLNLARKCLAVSRILHARDPPVFLPVVFPPSNNEQCAVGGSDQVRVRMDIISTSDGSRDDEKASIISLRIGYVLSTGEMTQLMHEFTSAHALTDTDITS
jgi:hypothetical protein